MILALLFLSATLLDRAVAVVDRDVVTLKDIRSFSTFHQMDPPEGNPQQEREIARMIILNRLKLQEIETMGGITVTEDEIQQALSDQLALSREGEMAEKAVTEMLDSEIRVRKYIEKRFVPQIYISDREINEVYVAKFEATPDPPRREIVREEIVRFLSLKKLNLLLQEWDHELLSRVQIRYIGEGSSGNNVNSVSPQRRKPSRYP